MTLTTFTDGEQPFPEQFNRRVAELFTAMRDRIVPAGILLPQPVGTLGWLPCDGRPVSRTTYAALFAAIGTIFGDGDGANTFNVPDMRGRAPIGAGQGNGLTNRVLGTPVGAETQTLTTEQLAYHQHPSGDPLSTNATGTGLGGRLPPIVPIESDATGSDEAHNNLQPSLVTNWMIKT